MAPPSKFKTFDIKVGSENAKLKSIARQVLNQELPVRYKIGLRDAILAMKEKERLGFNFNRSLTASLRSRWDVVENATVNFLQEIVDMNDQIEEDSKKNERQLMSLIFTRSTNISLEARAEQMGGLYMRMNFYKKVLEERIKQYDPCRNFLLQCCEMMGYLQPGQLLDRHAALIHVFKELYQEYDDRMLKMNKLQEKLQDIKSETDHRNMLLHNVMSELHMKLKALNTRITYMEYELNEKLDQSTNTEMELYRIKNSIHRSYVALMNYRSLEPTETDSFIQLEHILTRIQNAQDVIRYIRDEAIKQHLNYRRRHKEREEIAKSESLSTTSIETMMTEFNENKSRNRNANPKGHKFNGNSISYDKERVAKGEIHGKNMLYQGRSLNTPELPSISYRNNAPIPQRTGQNMVFNRTSNPNYGKLPPIETIITDPDYSDIVKQNGPTGILNTKLDNFNAKQTMGKIQSCRLNKLQSIQDLATTIRDIRGDSRDLKLNVSREDLRTESITSDVFGNSLESESTKLAKDCHKALAPSPNLQVRKKASDSSNGGRGRHSQYLMSSDTSSKRINKIAQDKNASCKHISNTATFIVDPEKKAMKQDVKKHYLENVTKLEISNITH